MQETAGDGVAVGNQGNRQEMPPPPINQSSSLMAVQPRAIAGETDISMAQPATFDIQNLQLALTRSQQTSSSTGLRRAVSAPHSIDSLAQPEPEYLPPSGGPMRRVQSSLGMRRSSSFFWTPAAHQEFERALNTLNARGAEVSAASIMTLMGLHSDLKMSDIERHLKKKLLVQRRVLAQLNTQSTGPLECSTGSSSQHTSPPMGRHRSPMPARSMAAVAEEPGPAESGGTPAAAVIATLTDQLDRQKQEHRQMAAMREHMLASAEGGAAVAT